MAANGTRPMGRGALRHLLTKPEDSKPPGQPSVPEPPKTDGGPAVPRALGLMQLLAKSAAVAAEAKIPETPKTACDLTPAAELESNGGRLPLGRGRMLKNLVSQPGNLNETSSPPPASSPAVAKPVTSSQVQSVEQTTSALESLTLVKKPSAQVPVPEVSEPLSHSKVSPEQRRGTSGTPLKLAVNYLRINVDEGKGIYEYDVSFDPPVDSRQLRFVLLKQHAELLGPARNFDGVTLYLPNLLGQQTTILTSTHPVDQSPVKVKIAFRRERSFRECCHFYNTLFRKIMAILEMVQSGRNYYNPRTPIQIPEHKLEVWPGYVTAVHEYDGGLLLCADVSYRVLRTATVHDMMINLSRSPNFMEEAQKQLIGLIVITKYNNKTYRVDEICTKETPCSVFSCRGKEMSYMEYYKMQYGIEIQDPGQFLLLSRVKRKIQGKEDETMVVCLIPELCHLSGLDDSLRKDFRAMKDLDAHTKLPPARRERSLLDFVRSVNNSEKASMVLKEWGLSLDPSIVVLDGRRLDQEMIHLGNDVRVPAGPNCDWTRSVVSTRVITPVDVFHWAIFFTPRDENSARGFADMMMRVAKDIGMSVAHPKYVRLKDDRTLSYTNAIKMAITPELQLVVLIMPSQREDRYGAVKVLCSYEMPIPSQVVLSKTISRPDKLRSVVQKIALQVNCKLGGELWAVHIPLKSFMVCGIDVYHDPTKGGRSVAGFVSSYNSTATRWYSQSCYQQPGQELVDELKKCFVEAISHYYKVNHCFPSNIFIFRDGVGDGRLETTARHEVAQLVDALALVQPDYNPRLCFIVVSKRINTRIFLKDRQLENPPPGTVVDHTITKKEVWDFFLVSQHVRQGTVTPTHFTVLRDGGLKAEYLQRISYKLTHMYYNWPGTIRVPAPCQYAHKLAYLVGNSMHRPAAKVLADRLHFL